MTLSSLVDTSLSPPVGVEVSLLMPRSGRTVVEVALTVAQSLPGLGSPWAGGEAVAAPAPGGTEPPVQAVFETVPARLAVPLMVSAGNAEPTARPTALGWSQTTTVALATQVQPAPLKPTKLSPVKASTTRSGPVAARGPLLVTVMVEVSAPPSATGSGVFLFAMRRSAPSGSTGTLTEPLLLPGAGSCVADAMSAVLVKLAPAPTRAPLGAWATSVMSSVAPTGRLARLQLTAEPTWLQAQFGPLAETKVHPAGKLSVTTALLATDGPALRGWITNVTGWPAIAGRPELTDFWAIRTSAPATTLVLTTAVLLVLSGSATPPRAGAMLALLVTVPPLAVTLPTSVMTGIATPTGCGPGRVQVTTPARLAQVQPLPAAETKLTEGGRLSVTTMSPESFGPALLAVRV